MQYASIYSDRECPLPRLMSFLLDPVCTFSFTQFPCLHNWRQNILYSTSSLFHSKRNINMDLVHFFPVQISLKRNMSPHTQWHRQQRNYIYLKVKYFLTLLKRSEPSIYEQSVFNRLLLGSLLWEFESSENPSCAEKSVGPWESLTIEKPVKSIINFKWEMWRYKCVIDIIWRTDLKSLYMLVSYPKETIKILGR
jgi:hypothetical protein